MFRTKKDVDHHVQDVFRKLKGENERTLRYYNIGKLYYQVGDYESTRRYVSSFLAAREDSACAHKLLGQALEALGQKGKALSEYRTSLMLETNQSDLVLKVCELMADGGEVVDKGTARYWCEHAEQLFPHNAAVFKLKEKLLTSEGDANTTELEALITAELAVRPKDVTLYVRLLTLYLEKERVSEAYNMAIEVEMRAAFRDELRWYDCLTNVFKTYRESNAASCGWEFYLHYTSVLERTACLNLHEQYGSPRRSLADCVQALFSLDQVLEEASCQSPPASEQDLYREYLRHERSQMCLHFATLLFKKAKKELSNWKDLCRVVAPLLLHALTPPPDQHGSWLVYAGKMRRKSADWWIKEAAYRNSQAGHVILGLLHHERRPQFLDHVMQFCSGNWRERVYQKIFNTRDHQQAMGSSHFVRHSSFIEPRLQLPTAHELRPYDEMSQKLHPDSLHHMVWLGLQDFSSHTQRSGGGTAKLGPDFRCLVFESLQLTCNNLNVAGSETLNRLDIDAFLYAAVLCARATLEEQQASGFCNSERPATLPANITEQLCTVDQAKWWTAAYRVFMNQSRGDLGDLRQTLQRGIEVVRVLGNHGLDVRLIVQLARTFGERATAMAARTEASTDLTAVEGRAALYWTSALPLLDRLQRNQAIRAPHTRLFEYQGKELSMAEVNTLLEEGRFFLACQLMKEDKHEKAVEAFQQLKSPYSSFYQAQIFKRLAAQEMEEKRGELITSEMRSQHIILLTKVREALYLTLDRLRSPGVDPKHPLNAELSTHIEEIESQLARIDPDVWRGDVNRNDLDAISDGSVSSVPSNGGENINSLSGFNNSSTYLHLTPKHLSNARMGSTPYRSGNRLDSDTPAQEHNRRTEARPSPERLEAQIRQIMHGRDSQMQTLVQQSKAIVESNKSMASSLAKVAQGVEELKSLIQELVKRETSKRHDVQLNNDLPQVCDAEEDLYVFDDDYSEEVNMAANHLSQYQHFPPYPNYPPYRQMSGILGTSTVTYGPPPMGEAGAPPPAPPQLMPPGTAMGGFFRNIDPALMYPPTLGYYGQGALPFSEGQQLPDFRGPPAASVFSRLGAGVVPQDSPGLHKLAQAPVAPVNVVITSSDTLPTTAPLTQPTLSVTIPPQHRLGAPLVHTVPLLGQTPVVVPGMPPPLPAPIIHPGVLNIPGPQPAFPVAQTAPTAPVTSQAVPFSTPPVASTSSGSSAVPHAFQISMPPQAQVPVASRLEKGAAALSPVLPISTQTLLSSVPSPVYSAVVPDKSPANKDISCMPKQHRVSTGSAAGEEEEVDIEHDPCPDFQPVIPLPAEVELNTGEEDEKLLYEGRCKLFRFVEKEWKERGVGMLKLLHHKENGKVRVLMRREQVLKVCANHFLKPDIELAPMNDRAWMWAANDFADEKMKLEKLCARFKTADEAANFRDAFYKARELARYAKPSPVKSSADRASSLPGTAQNNTPPVSTTTSDKTSSVSSSTSSSTASTPATSAEKIVVGGFTFVSPPIFNMSQMSSQKTAAKDTAKEEKKVGSPKPSPFAMFSFGNVSAKSPPVETTSAAVTSTTPVLDEPPPLRRPHSIPVRPPSNSGTSPQTTVTDKGKATAAGGSGDQLMFTSPINITFSSLASGAKEVPFKADSNFQGFQGAGKPLFGGGASRTSMTSKKSDGAGGGEEEETSDDFVPTAEFKPVVPLPELVVVKTGEEGEEVLYQERAKLLRFDSDAKEWKERGRGQMKILKDPTSGKIRLLMRREQVLKVCCNHNLLMSMQFKTLPSSDRAWSWYAQDYSEGEVRPEFLALRFKTVEQAQAFKAAIDKCQTKMKDSGPVPTSQEKKQHADTWKCEECLFPNAGDTNKCRSCSRFRRRSISQQQLPKLSELFRPAAGSWECTTCYIQNSGVDDKCLACNRPNPSKTHTKMGPTLEMFNPNSGFWECKVCNNTNEDTHRQCVSCETDRRDTPNKTPASTPLGKQNGPSSKPLSEIFKPKAGSWECKTCYIRNSGNVIACMACTTAKPGHEAAVKEAETGSAGLTFGIQSASTPLNLGTSSGGFTFGIAPGAGDAGGGGFKFDIPASSTPSTTAQSAATSLFASPTTKVEFSFGMPTVTTTIAILPRATTSDSAKASTKPFIFEPKPGSTPFQFGTSGSNATDENTKSSFIFDTSSNWETTPPRDGALRNFVFGSTCKFPFNFSGVRPKSPVKSPKSPGVVAASGGEDESGSEPEEDEGEHIFFQPVIPLPDKVPLHTGEEDEDMLYCHRAKLYRFLNGEWKERGVGDIKLLRHRETSKVRLLMRREQVLKLCLNHFLTADLSFVEKDEKSWLWTAPDFSEGEIRQESFAMRFANKEVAAAFKEAVDKAQAEMGLPSPRKGEEALPAVAVPEKSPQPTAKEQGAGDDSSVMKNFTFSIPDAGSASSTTPQPGSPAGNKGVARTLFEDISDTVESDDLYLTDDDYDERKSDAEREDDGGEVVEVYRLTVTPEERAKALRLKLPENFYSYRQKPPCPGCLGCEPDTDVESRPSLESSCLTPPSFLYGLHMESLELEAKDDKSAATVSAQESLKKSVIAPPVFSIANTSTQLFSVKPVDTTTQASLTTSVFGKAVAPPMFGQPSVFGQSTKGSMFSQPSTQIGPMKSIFGQAASNTTTAPQQSPILATPLFGQVTSSTSASPVFGLAATTTSSIFGQETTTTISSVFGEGTTTSTINLFNPMPLTTSSSMFGGQTSLSFTQHRGGPPPLFSEESNRDSLPSSTNSIFGQITSTDSSNKPLFGQLTSTFPKAPLFGQTVSGNSESDKPTTASIFGQLPGSSNSMVSATPVFGLQPSLSDTSTAPKTTTPSLFSAKPTFSFMPTTTTSSSEPSPQLVPFSFTKPPASAAAAAAAAAAAGSNEMTQSKPVGFEFKPRGGEPFTFAQSGAQQETKTADVQPSVPEPKPEEPPKVEEEGVPFLPTHNSLSFASVATKTGEPIFASTAPETIKPFAWADAGTTVFGNSPLTRSPRSTTVGSGGNTSTPGKSGGSDNEGEEEGAGGADDSSYDPHFEPIIALPDAIEVRTGEEDEIKVFCHRAKLYRYESASKEWKERGVGEMKILKHSVHGTYRFLLRREQVYKVVCNQRLTADLELKPLSTSDRTWCWGGMNHAEDEARVEELAVRFKLPETAQEFYARVRECVEDVSKRATAELSSSQAAEGGANTGGRSSVSDEEDLEDDVDEEEDEDDEEEDDLDEEGMGPNLMFEKRATLYRRQLGDHSFTVVGQGDLQVVYDAEYYAARVIVEADGTGNMLCNTIIAINTELEVKKKDCEWTAVDYSEDPPAMRMFRARFSSETAAKEFELIFNEGKEMAKQSGIMDHMDPLQILED